jgi:hypothetical protein
MIEVRIFGQLEDITSTPTVLIKKVGDTDSLQEELFMTYPALKEKKFSIAVNQNIIHQNTMLDDNAQVALLPPFSGG